MGMELEFIDLSNDEENEVPRVSNGANGRRMSSGAQKRSRNQAPVMIQIEGRRSDRPERQRRLGEKEIQTIRTQRPETGTQRRPSAVPDGRRVSQRSVTPALPEREVRRRPRPSTAERETIKRRPRPADPEVERKRALRRRRRRRRMMAARMGTLFFLIFMIAGSGFLLYKLLADTAREKKPQAVINNTTTVKREEVIEANEKTKPGIVEDFLTVNEYSRPGEPLLEVNNIFVHYTANPGTSAAQNRSYFENLGITGETSASAHFVIGYEGEIVQCIPLNEIAYAVMKRNYDSISIECCYLTDDGKFTDATYRSLIWLSAWLLNEYDLAPEDMRRHYDEGGKKCPLYYVEHEEAWNQFLRDLEEYIMNEQV